MNALLVNTTFWIFSVVCLGFVFYEMALCLKKTKFLKKDKDLIYVVDGQKVKCKL